MNWARVERCFADDTSIVVSELGNEFRTWKLDEPGCGYVEPEQERWMRCRRWGLRDFEVSTMGNVKQNGIPFTPIKSTFYDITYDCVTNFQTLHHLVLCTFKPNPFPGYYTCVDHINRDRTDNRLCNVRWSTQQLNQLNIRYTIQQGVTSYSTIHSGMRYRARLCFMYKKLHLGTFYTLEEAASRYREAKRDAFEILEY